MRILRNILYIFVVVGGIVLASANMTLVRFVYLPGIAFLTNGQSAEAEVPLALLLLGFLLLGALVAGTGTFVEHVRLRFLVRRNAKVVKGLRADLEKARAEIEEARAAVGARDSDLANEQARVRRAEEAEAKALAIAEQERTRADQAVSALAPPPGA
ncbi:MAG: lipopolysaccharide assembly protein LapA domain-containing protein [Candidatus Binatia bacterium]